MSRGVYVAYPIDQRNLSHELGDMFDQINKFKADLISSGLAEWVFDPGDAFLVSGRAALGDVAHINRHAHSCADVIMAFLPKGVPSIGVPMEVDRGMSQGKEVFLFSDTESYMLHYGTNKRFRRWPGWDSGAREEALIQLSRIDWVAREEQWAPQYLPFKLDSPDLLPSRTYGNDAGLDLVVSEDTVIGPGEFVDVRHGASVELPNNLWGLIQGRSSTLRQRQLLVNPGVIDSGYRGGLYAGCWNLGNEDAYIKQGERIAQLILMSNMARHYVPVQVEELALSQRGENGFGSSGS